ncbi:MAG: response regulator [Spirochaetota bacterium]
MKKDKHNPGNAETGRDPEKNNLIHELQVHQIELRMQNEELRRIQEELEISRDKYTSLYDFSPVGYVTVNMEGVIEEANLHIADMLGTGRIAFIGKHFTDYIKKSDQDIFYKLKQLVMTAEGHHSADIGLRKINNNEFYCRLEILAIKKTQEKDTKFRIIISDITALRQAESEIARANEELKKRILAHNAQLRELTLELSQTEQRERKRLANILHDHLQQLLVSARMGLEKINRQSMDPEIRKSLEYIISLIDDSVSVSRSLVLDLSPPILHEAGFVPALKWLSRWMMEKHGMLVNLNTEIKIKPEQKGITIQLFGFVRELLLNVAKHAGTKEAWVNVTMQDNFVVIEVKDTGKGFDSKECEINNPGGGFGLISLRERISLMGGEMSIESCQGQGTHAILRMPAKNLEIEKASPEPALKKPEQAAAPEGQTKRSTKIRVLVADDHKIMREGLVGLFRGAPDMEIVGEANNGENALEMVRLVKPDVVIMDINMPVMNGIEATEAIMREIPGTVVIGLSMHDEHERGEELRRAGAIDYINKASASEELIASVRKYARVA